MAQPTLNQIEKQLSDKRLRVRNTVVEMEAMKKAGILRPQTTKGHFTPWNQAQYDKFVVWAKENHKLPQLEKVTQWLEKRGPKNLVGFNKPLENPYSGSGASEIGTAVGMSYKHVHDIDDITDPIDYMLYHDPITAPLVSGADELMHAIPEMAAGATQGIANLATGLGNLTFRGINALTGDHFLPTHMHLPFGGHQHEGMAYNIAKDVAPLAVPVGGEAKALSYLRYAPSMAEKLAGDTARYIPSDAPRGLSRIAAAFPKLGKRPIARAIARTVIPGGLLGGLYGATVAGNTGNLAAIPEDALIAGVTGGALHGLGAALKGPSSLVNHWLKDLKFQAGGFGKSPLGTTVRSPEQVKALLAKIDPTSLSFPELVNAPTMAKLYTHTLGKKLGIGGEVRGGISNVIHDVNAQAAKIVNKLKGARNGAGTVRGSLADELGKNEAVQRKNASALYDVADNLVPSKPIVFPLDNLNKASDLDGVEEQDTVNKYLNKPNRVGNVLRPILSGKGATPTQVQDALSHFKGKISDALKRGNLKVAGAHQAMQEGLEKDFVSHLSVDPKYRAARASADKFYAKNVVPYQAIPKDVKFKEADVSGSVASKLANPETREFRAMASHLSAAQRSQLALARLEPQFKLDEEGAETITPSALLNHYESTLTQNERDTTITPDLQAEFDKLGAGLRASQYSVAAQSAPFERLVSEQRLADRPQEVVGGDALRKGGWMTALPIWTAATVGGRRAGRFLASKHLIDSYLHDTAWHPTGHVLGLAHLLGEVSQYVAPKAGLAAALFSTPTTPESK